MQRDEDQTWSSCRTEAGLVGVVSQIATLWSEYVNLKHVVLKAIRLVIDYSRLLSIFVNR